MSRIAFVFLFLVAGVGTVKHAIAVRRHCPAHFVAADMLGAERERERETQYLAEGIESSLETFYDCESVKDELLEFVQEDQDQYQYDTLLSVVGKNTTCQKYFDVDYTVQTEERFKIFGENTLHWQTLVAKAMNRVNFYREILGNNTGHWATTSLTGMLTILKLLEKPFQSLWKNKDGPTAVMDAGSGSGALMAAMSLMTPKHTTFMGIEYEAEMAKKSADWLNTKSVFVNDDKIEESAAWVDLPTADRKADGSKTASELKQRMEVYQGDAMAMKVCRQLPHANICDINTTAVSLVDDLLDILAVGFGLFESGSKGSKKFPNSILRVVKTGGYVLIPVCSEKLENHSGYCKEEMTVFQKMDNNNQLQEVSDVPQIEGKFFYLGADPIEADKNY